MAHTLTIIIIVMTACVCCKADLCSVYSNIQNMTTSHTSCLQKTSANVAQADQTTIVDNHNRVRNNLTDASNMMKLTWDDKLADLAQRWADTCTGGHDTKQDRYLYGYYSVGQNAASGTKLENWKDAMDAWEEEKFDWTYEQGSINGKTVGHYTQMIWATTVKIGCGYKLCGTEPQYVCNYGPAGNGPGKPYVTGTSTNCQTTDTAYERLCDCGGKVCRNTGTLDTASCSCSCPPRNFYTGVDCEINCDAASDYSVCGQAGWEVDKCIVYSNMAPVYCPKFCSMCPAISGL